MAKIDYRKEAKDRDCHLRIPGVCNGDSATVVLCHLSGAGIGRKHHDLHGAWGCSACHDAVDGRVRCGFEAETLRLWHYEAVIRTQTVLMSEGKM